MIYYDIHIQSYSRILGYARSVSCRLVQLLQNYLNNILRVVLNRLLLKSRKPISIFPPASNLACSDLSEMRGKQLEANTYGTHSSSLFYPCWFTDWPTFCGSVLFVAMFLAVSIQTCSHCIGQIIAVSALYLAMHEHFQREENLNILGAFHLEIFLSHDSLPIGTSEALRSQSLNGVPELSLDKAKVCQVDIDLAANEAGKTISARSNAFCHNILIGFSRY